MAQKKPTPKPPHKSAWHMDVVLFFSQAQRLDAKELMAGSGSHSKNLIKNPWVVTIGIHHFEIINSLLFIWLMVQDICLINQVDRKYEQHISLCVDRKKVFKKDCVLSICCAHYLFIHLFVYHYLFIYISFQRKPLSMWFLPRFVGKMIQFHEYIFHFSDGLVQPQSPTNAQFWREKIDAAEDLFPQSWAKTICFF